MSAAPTTASSLDVRRETSRRERSLRSDEDLDAIVSERSTGFGRWSGLVLAAGIAAALGVCAFIRHRDVVVAPFVLSTGPPPARLVAPTSGYWRILSAEGAAVEEGEVVAVRDSDGDSSVVERLDRLLAGSEGPALLAELEAVEPSGLGGLAGPVADLVDALSRSEDPEARAAWDLRRAVLELERERQRSVMSQERLQETIAEKAVELAREKRRRLERLVGEGIAAEGQLGDADLDLLGREAERRRAAGAVELGRLELLRLDRRSSEIANDERVAVEERRLRTKTARDRLRVAVEAWKAGYRIASPRRGLAVHFGVSSGRRFLNEGEEVLAVVSSAGPWEATAMLEAGEVTEVEAGQDARLLLDTSRDRREHELAARVVSVAPVPHQDRYLVRFEVRARRSRRVEAELASGRELTGSAEILTRETSLLARIVGGPRPGGA